jgi:ATP-dependent Lhr-like helicase
MKCVHPGFKLSPAIAVPERLAEGQASREEALVEIIRGRLEALGPVKAAEISESLGAALQDAEQALLTMEGEGCVQGA